jgi:MscS family membrane protein
MNQTTLAWPDWLAEHTWLLEVLVVLLLLFFLNFILKKVIERSRQKAHLQEHDWRHHLNDAMMTPLRILLVLLLISFGIELACRQFNLENSFSFVEPLRNAGIVLCLAWFLIRWKKIFYNAMAARRVKGKPSFDPISLEIMGRIFTILVIFISLLVLLGVLGLDVVPLLTFGGIGAAALGFASKDVVANFFGGWMLYVTRPFTIQDLIELPEKNIKGHVEDIGWYLTSLRDLAKQPIYIPNAMFSTQVMVNLSRITHRKIEEKISIRYSDMSKVDKIVEKVRSLLERHTEIDQHQAIHVYLLTFGSYALEIEIKAYTLATRYEEFMELKQKILLEIYNLVAELGAEMPYPTTTVNVVR